MRRRSHPVLGGALRAVLAGTVLLALAVARDAAGVELGLQVGRTFAVGSPALSWRGLRANTSAVYETDKPSGGYAFAASALWPLADRFRVGVTAYAEDAGTWMFDEQAWRAVQGTSGEDLGELEMGQLDAFGAAWRVDAVGPAIGRLGHGFASITYGYYRWKVDHSVGMRTAPAGVSDSLVWEVPAQTNAGARQSAVGATLALGVEHALGAHQTFGISITGTGLSSDFTRRFLGAHLEWRWRL